MKLLADGGVGRPFEECAELAGGELVHAHLAYPRARVVARLPEHRLGWRGKRDAVHVVHVHFNPVGYAGGVPKEEEHLAPGVLVS